MLKVPDESSVVFMSESYRDRIQLGKLDVDLEQQDVFLANSDIPASLRPQAAKLLITLAENAGQVVTKQSLMDAVWPGVIVTDDSIVQAVRDVRLALDDHEHRIVRTVRGRGYRLVQVKDTKRSDQVKTRAGSSIGTSGNPFSGLNPQDSSVYRLRLWISLALAISIVSIWFIAGHLSKNRSVSLSGTDRVTSAEPGIAVFPFRELESKTGIGEWLAEDLVQALARDGRMRVISQYSSFVVSLKEMSANEISKTLNVRFLVNGHVIRQGEDVQLDIQLVDLSVDHVVWSDSFSSEGGAVAGIADSITYKISGRLLTSVQQAARRQALISEPSNLATYDLTQRALALKHRFTQSATLEAQALLEKAMQLDPEYAAPKAAYCWVNALDALFGLTGKWSSDDANTIIAQCQSSVALDPHPALPYIALADAYMLAGQWKAAARTAKQATERAPGDAEAWLMYAFHLLPVETAQLANQALDKALPLFPVKLPFVNLLAAQIAWANGDLQLAWDSATACVQNAPHLDMCSAILALVYIDQDQPELAEKQLGSLRASSTSFNPLQACSRFTGQLDRHQQCLAVLTDQ